MALRDELIALLRERLNPGFETATLATLLKEYVLRDLGPALKARRVAALDDSALILARQAAEDALKAEEDARKAAVADVSAAVDAELGAV